MAALARTGRVRPTVVSFESVPLVGPPRLRGLQRAAIERSIEGTIRDGSMDPFAAMASVGPPGVATARLPFASGAAPGRGPDHGSVSRSVVLLALGDRLTRAGRTPDLVHAHTGYPDGAAAAELAAALDRPLIITEHSSTVQQVLASPATRERYEEAIARAERIIAVSESLAAELRAGVAGLAPGSPTDLMVIPNAVPIEEFAGAVESERRPDELLFVGYRKPTKGIACLLRAFAQVRARRPAATLRLIGRSPTPEVEADWIALAAELGVSEAVRFEGPADRATVADALRRASVFVHPSPRETFGVVAVEALAAGTPVVAADSGGVTEILGPRPESVGAIVPPDDPMAMADAIVRVLEARATFGLDALRARAAQYSAAVVADRLADLYESVIETPRSRPSGGPVRGIPMSGSASTDRPGSSADAGEALPMAVVVAGFAPAVMDGIIETLPGALRESIQFAGATGARTRITDRMAELLVATASLGAPPRGPRPIRALRILSHPSRAWQRLRVPRAFDRLIRIDARRTVETAVADLGGRPGRPIGLIVLDGVAQLASDTVLSSGSARQVPGGLRHLADIAAGAPIHAQGDGDGVGEGDG